MNYKSIATKFGEEIKYYTSINEIRREFSALTELSLENYPNDSITSSRSQLTYSWVMTIGNSSLSEIVKKNIISDAIVSLVRNKDKQEELLSLFNAKLPIKLNAKNYVNESRIEELKSIKCEEFDLSRLIKYCEELNTAFNYESYLSTAMLVRSIIDHIPPIFHKGAFTEIANNYNGSKSFKDSMKNLDNSSRKISDSHLHTQVRNKEVLPNSNQVDFSNDIDVLLAEIYRLLK
jgi:hypothetical protein